MNDLYLDIKENVKKLEDNFKDASDFLLREVMVNGQKGFFAIMDGLVDSLALVQMAVRPILQSKIEFSDGFDHYTQLKDAVVGGVELNEAKNFDDLEYFLMSGFVVFMVDGCNKAMVLGIQGWSKRETAEPTNEAMSKGAKECFVESINDNKALVRKRLKTHHLKFKQLKLGKNAKIPVVIAYIDDRVDSDILKNVETRLNNTDLSVVIDYGCLLPFINTDVNSFFSSVGVTERPDTFSSKLLEGRIGVIVDGTPFSMYVPYLFSDNFQCLDDYDNPPFYATFIRVLKYFSFFSSVFLPGIYVAIGTFHQEILPTNLLFTIASAESTTPFSLMTEAILIFLLYEIMREAGLRLPQSIGHAVSIIGGLVIGEATVTAGLIGAPMLIIVAITAISSYVVYQLYETVAVLKLFFIVVGGLTGIYGIVIGASMLFVNICSLNTYGVPYTSPITPLNKFSLADIFVRDSWKKLAKRKVRVQNFRGVSIDKKL